MSEAESMDRPQSFS